MINEEQDKQEAEQNKQDSNIFSLHSLSRLTVGRIAHTLQRYANSGDERLREKLEELEHKLDSTSNDIEIRLQQSGAN